MATNWAMLEPYWRVIQAYDPEFTTRQRIHEIESDLRGICVTLPPRCDAAARKTDLVHELRQLRDALELVFLHSLVDRSASFEMAAEFVTSDSIDATQVVPCHVDVVVSPLLNSTRKFSLRCSQWMVAAVSALLEPQPMSERDAGFQATRTKILAEIPVNDAETRALCEDNMTISVGLGAQDITDAIVEELASLLQSQRVLLPATQRNDFPFRSAELDIGISPSKNSLRALARLEASLAPGCALRFRYVYLQGDSIREPTAYGTMLTTLLRPQASSVFYAKPESHHGSVATYMISTPSDHGRFIQIWSAVMQSREIESLCVSLAEPDEETRRQQLRWIGHSLFSSAARHRIHHVTFGDVKSVTASDVDNLRECIATSDNRTPLLFDNHDDHDKHTKQVFVAKKTTLWIHPVTTRQRKEIRLAEDAWLDVVADSSSTKQDWIVLVPAYGQCGLASSDVVDQRVNTSDNLRLDDHGITSLEFTMESWGSNEPSPGMLALLRAVGKPVQKLSIFSTLRASSDFWLEIFGSCPKLTALRLIGATVTRLDRLVGLYEKGVCKLTGLELELWRVEPRESILGFLAALADPATVIARTLRELSFGLDWNINPSLNEHETAAIQLVLERNTTLRFCEIRLSSGAFARFGALLQGYNDQWIHEARDPLPMRAKWACLSVFSGQGLDSDVLGRIFALAAQAIKRRVVVECV